MIFTHRAFRLLRSGRNNRKEACNSASGPVSPCAPKVAAQTESMSRATNRQGLHPDTKPEQRKRNEVLCAARESRAARRAVHRRLMDFCPAAGWPH